MPGISGFACYFPSPCVELADWADWTGNSASKLHAVVGRSFRMCPPDENIYTMAAEAVLSLINNYDIDPSRVGFLGLGTESSTDNSAGAIIVKGLVDRALKQMGRSMISRACEVPEVKHACLGGIYAMKSALRFLQTDGAGELAIVVATDVALYEPGSSGEQTQGAGAVAMLLEAEPRLLEIDLADSARASSYRHADFRKPLGLDRPVSDFHYPVFQGKFSTSCYIESLLAASGSFYDRSVESPVERLQGFDAIFLHRPYQRMAETGVAFLYLLALVKQSIDENHHASDGRLVELAESAGVEVSKVMKELTETPDLIEQLLDGRIDADVFPQSQTLVRVMRKDPTFTRLTTSLGGDMMQSLGNLYSASLPTWIAAGFASAAETHFTFTAQEILAVGYGSGDATEVMPMRVVDGWQAHAQRINVKEAMDSPQRLNQKDYEDLQRGLMNTGLCASGRFRLTTPGKPDEFGLEAYGFETNEKALSLKP